MAMDHQIHKYKINSQVVIYKIQPGRLCKVDEYSLPSFAARQPTG